VDLQPDPNAGRLFSWPVDQPEDLAASKICRSCLNRLDKSLFGIQQRIVRADGAITGVLQPSCRACVRKNGKLVAELKRLHYEAMWHRQEGKCWFSDCNERRPIDGIGPGGRLNLDHDHQAGTARGLLCVNHNQAIGKFHDNGRSMVEAAYYLGMSLTEVIDAYLATSRQKGPT
jgi:hypothetical protein